LNIDSIDSYEANATYISSDVRGCITKRDGIERRDEISNSDVWR
jgi:hypothetical protein